MSGVKAKNPIERFLAKVQPLDNGCWQWLGATMKGYGVFRIGSRTDGSYRIVKAHRFAFEHYKGAIPENLTLDHLCRNEFCVNPDHLEAVTNAVNVLRGDTITAANAKKTHCPKGHIYDLLNTGYSGNLRYCRTCKRLKSQLRRKGVASVV